MPHVHQLLLRVDIVDQYIASQHRRGQKTRQMVELCQMKHTLGLGRIETDR